MHLIEQRLARLDQGKFFASRIGVEKESLRTTRAGYLAQTPHPSVWGATLTHPALTTDYAEALTEFITPPLTQPETICDHLLQWHTYASQHLADEQFWAASMPCRLPSDDQIRVADYGSSNLGQMKQLYRVGLGHRYGRAMQVIAGVHFNWSLPDGFWQHYADLTQSTEPGWRTLRDVHSLGLIRNIIRFGWLIPYLFGMSPVVGQSFLASEPTQLRRWGQQTYYQPDATSLRMGDIGYQNSTDTGSGWSVNYNTVRGYASSLLQATLTPSPVWQKIKVRDGNQYRQLNDHILQIENEYYSSVRPKQLTHNLESPAIALVERGINHIELRSLDINLHTPIGITPEQLYFLDSFMLTCLLAPSLPLNQQEQQASRRNLRRVAQQGRAMQLPLERAGQSVNHRDWGLELLQTMSSVCAWLDQQHDTDCYTRSLATQKEKIKDPTLTPAAQLWHEIKHQQTSFYELVADYSAQHHQFFRQQTLTPEQQHECDQISAESRQQLARIEAEDQIDFNQFLAHYFSSVTRAAKRLDLLPAS
ncbi:MAG: glutamate--cysteine ligase [Pseudomonadota bacterium]